jgi:hypothetical protein
VSGFCQLPVTSWLDLSPPPSIHHTSLTLHTHTLHTLRRTDYIYSAPNSLALHHSLTHFIPNFSHTSFQTSHTLCNPFSTCNTVHTSKHIFLALHSTLLHIHSKSSHTHTMLLSHFTHTFHTLTPDSSRTQNILPHTLHHALGALYTTSLSHFIVHSSNTSNHTYHFSHSSHNFSHSHSRFFSCSYRNSLTLHSTLFRQFKPHLYDKLLTTLFTCSHDSHLVCHTTGHTHFAPYTVTIHHSSPTWHHTLHTLHTTLFT